MIELETTTIPITPDMCPIGPLYEDDGSCWTAIVDSRESKGWRWRPNNWDAFAKGEPSRDCSMSEIHPKWIANLRMPERYATAQ